MSLVGEHHNTEARIEAHLRRLAFDIGPRSMGTTANTQAYEYIRNVVASTGARLSVHESTVTLPLPKSWACSAETAGTIEEVAILPGVSTLELRPKRMPVTQRIYSSIDELNDFPPDTGSLAVIAGGTLHESDACAIADSAAAVAWFRDGHPGLYSGTCARLERRPTVAGFAIDEMTARRWTTQDAVVTASIDVQQHEVTLRNVVADIGVDSEESVPCFVAHFDTKPMCPGANDNASGIAVLLAMLETWASDKPARFLFFDGEEGGLLGSSAYVEAMAKENRLNEFGLIVCPDSVGLGELHLYTADRLGPFPDDVLEQTRAAFDQFGTHISERKARSGSSDYLPFHQLGIPCVFLSDFPNRVRHTTEDVVEHIDRGVLVQLAAVLSSDTLLTVDKARLR